MNKVLLAGLALVGLTSVAADAAEPSLCQRVADEARRAPPATWTQPEPLSAWVKSLEPGQPSPITTALASDARWRALLGAPGAEPLRVQQLPDTPVYLVDHTGGTAHCQSLVLVEAAEGRPVRQLASPFALKETELCTTRFARWARVLGERAFVAGGAPSMASPDLDYRIAAWTGQGWGPACGLKLRRATQMIAADRFCAPGAHVCSAGQQLAERLARAYEAARASRAPLDGKAFSAGHRPKPGILAALNPPLAEPGAIGDMNPPFPLFGSEAQPLDAMLTVFSNADPRRLPVFVDGRWWLAVVGRAGVGWREGDAVLVALFAPPGRARDGVASYQFRVGPATLLEVKVSDEAP